MLEGGWIFVAFQVLFMTECSITSLSIRLHILVWLGLWEGGVCTTMLHCLRRLL